LRKVCAMNRRELFTIAGNGLATSMLSGVQAADPYPVRLILVHGRSQQGRDPFELQSIWMETLRRGAAKINRTLPEGLDVAFPYYGDKLDELARQSEIPVTNDIQAKGHPVNDDFLKFQAAVAEAMRSGAGITDAQVQQEFGAHTTERGPQNWAWVQAIIRAIDRYSGGVSQSTIEFFMRDIYLYTTRAGVRDEIDRLVGPVLNETPCVVIGHSLGSVVAYNILRTDRRALKVEAYITVGCPLAIRAIRDQLRPIGFPTPVKAWYNAFDPKDVVALYPLDARNFPVSSAIENYGKVRNATDNRHGIIGYLDDADVAKHVLDALGA
jgi:pimeloyl-ACP methyl ester carboxylesterase